MHEYILNQLGKNTIKLHSLNLLNSISEPIVLVLSEAITFLKKALNQTTCIGVV